MRYIVPILFSLIIISPVCASNNLDSDYDGVPDKDEINLYHTNQFSVDTDKDGYSDWVELNNGFSPLENGNIKLEKSDYDDDGLSDRDELKYGTNLAKVDTDDDGFKDLDEIKSGHDPLIGNGKKLEKRIDVNLAKQELSYYNGRYKIGTFQISSGKKSTPTPKGEFKIKNKYPKAWSKDYGLWMPYWLGLKDGSFGLHELPVWPNGYREGKNHLGKPVSHGCMRLGIGPAKILYDWAEVGTKVIIK